MSANTPIEWTDHTFNIAWGCEKVSPGCAHCYADTLSTRFGQSVWGKDKPRRTFGEKHWAEPLKWSRAAEKAGVVTRVFCSSMCDVFEDHPTIDAEREKLWPLIRETPWLDWQLLTKRPERILPNLPSDWGEGYGNVWLGTSVESHRYLLRAEMLAFVPARTRFISAEPLLRPLDLTILLSHKRIDWIIVGGESGPKCRPMQPAWAKALRDQCATANVAFFLKQLGGHPDKRGHDKAVLDGKRYTEMPERAA